MQVPGKFYVNSALEPLIFEELEAFHQPGGSGGGFIPAMKQLSNVASLPGELMRGTALVLLARSNTLDLLGIVGASIGLPDVHSGYGFAIGP